MKCVRHSLAMIWRWPAVLAGLTLAGLLSALLGQHGIWLVISWVLLAIPPVVIVGCLQRRQTRGT
ncbi:hypothetical protein [Bradyrhizobium sp. Ai1a-2]|uniref:hypothetical protein n=1 Tax=Bradyrhizobium sp. Ai1a-2 TaxID=196490 RepID=UPI00040FE241|nr:hypothetical protein [Bradyrhizobium sp. Ai1a-2]